MKLTVEVDLSDFYSESDVTNFSDQIKNHIAWTVRQQIAKEFKTQAQEEYFTDIKKQVKEQCNYYFFENLVNEVITTQKIKKNEWDKNSDELITVKEYAENVLKNVVYNDNTIKETIKKYVQQLADKLVREIKQRYDLVFATKIVSKLADNKMLKEDVAKLLLPEINNN